MVRVIYGVLLKNRKKISLNEERDNMAMANSKCWHGHVMREDSHVLRRELDFEVEGQRKKWRLKNMAEAD